MTEKAIDFGGLLELINELRHSLRAVAGRNAGLSNAEVMPIAALLAALFERFDYSASYGALDNAQGREVGPCAQLAALAATLYGVPHSRIGLGGSSNTNVTIAQALPHHFGREVSVLIDMAAHASVVGGHAMTGSKVSWLQRRFLPELGVQAPLTHSELANAIDLAPELDAVVLTLPIYDGFAPADMKSLRRVCDERDVLLIVDAAWGFFHGVLTECGFPQSAAGIADVTTISPHKKGCGLSQNSLALFRDSRLLASFDAVSDLGLASTSPAYYSYLPLEVGLSFWASPQSQALGQEMVVAAESFSDAMEAIPGIERIRAEDLGPGFVGDPCHLLFRTQKTGLTGYQILKAIDCYNDIDAEKATLDSVLFLMGPAHVGNWRETVDAVAKVVESLPKSNLAKLPSPPTAPVSQVLTPHDAMFKRRKLRVPILESVGRVAAQMVAAYPPGAAIIVPGGIVTAEAVEFLRAVKAAGSRLKGIDGPFDEYELLVADHSS